MRAAVLLCGGVLLRTVAASVTLSHRSLRRQDDGDDGDDGDDAEENYLSEVCFPNWSPDSDDLSTGTPCEAFAGIQISCEANGTLPIDLLAQQECICGAGSGYFEMLAGCNDCLKVHGGTENYDYYDTSFISSASSSFCTGTPTTDFDDLLDNMASTVVPASVTGTDLFPNQTAVSLYYTGSILLNGGQITGSAALATYTGSFSGSGPESTSGDRIFPSQSITTGLAPGQTGISTSGTVTTIANKSSSKVSNSGSSTSTGTSRSSDASSTASSTSASAKATGNAAAGVKVMGGMLAFVAAGVVYVL